MSSPANSVPPHRPSRQDPYQGSWPSIVRMIVLEIVLLLALAGALVYYLNWSSEAVVSEFMATGQPQLHAVKYRAPCGHRA